MADNNHTHNEEYVAEKDAIQVAKLNVSYKKLRKEIAKKIVGQDEVVDQILVSIFARGHCLLVGVPGLAKTLMISTLAKAMNLDFSRIQFTPDLMPSDITGTEVIQEDAMDRSRKFKFLRGPIFSNVILADEINRTPPKTQAALLEAMEERQVSAGGMRYPMQKPFFVLATQNPIEQEGTYPLPAAQLDRFMFNIYVDYPNRAEEKEIVRKTTTSFDKEVEIVLSKEDIIELQNIVRRVPIKDEVLQYATNIVRATRLDHRHRSPLKFVEEWLEWGAGPRAAQYLILGGKARACLQGRYFVTHEDVRAVAYPVIRHRIIANFQAEAEGITPNKIVDEIVRSVPEDGSFVPTAAELAPAAKD